MNIPAPNLKSDESRNPFRDDANAVAAGTGWAVWRRNWLPLFVIVVPASMGVLLMHEGNVWNHFSISFVGGVLYLSSFYAAAIWTGLGRKTRTRSAIDWSILMFTLFSSYTCLIAASGGRGIRIEIVQTISVFIAFCLVHAVLVPGFLPFRNMIPFFSPDDSAAERITIADLLTITSTVAICLGIIRGSNALIPGTGEVGDISAAVSKVPVEVLWGIAIAVIAGLFLGSILDWIFGLPLILLASYCWRKLEFESMAVCFAIQLAAVVFCCIAVSIVSEVLENEMAVLIHLLIGLAGVQACFFLILVSLMATRFPQGDEMATRRDKRSLRVVD